MEFLAYAFVAVLWGGSIYGAVAYTRKALQAAHQVKLEEAKPAKRKYVRKAKAAPKSGVVAATMTPATGMTEAGKAYLNGHADTTH